MTIALGIDTGGTYTDAVLVELDSDRGHVIAGAKALTTRRDLAIGIGQAVEAVFAGAAIHPDEVGLVALSTTLATNAIVEGQGSSIALLLIGYDPELIRQFGFEKDLVTRDVVYLAGGHDVVGDEVRPLDEGGVRQAILARRGQVEAFAVSGYFSVRNPAHELRVRELVAELTGADGNPVPVTCGHELTTRLNSVRRATTAALNARLIPLLQELIATVRQTLVTMGIHAPLMVVKGDGSLVRSEWALRRPIETILSGPAASVVGAWYLASKQDIWVVDVGGTTTDIAALRDGRPRLNPEGASVGRWQTMVEAVDVHTVGLGGDSHVRVRDGRQIAIGPRRVVPLCLLASEHPAVVDQLRAQVQNHPSPDEAGLFVLRNRQPNRDLTADEVRLLAALEGGPQSLQRLTGTMRYGLLVRQQVDRLTGERLVLQAGFTPTDALHCLGRFQRWDSGAARLGAELLASQAGVGTEAFCEQVVAGVPARVAQELVTKVLNDEAVRPHWADEPAAAALLARALGEVPDSGLGCRLTLRRPVVAIGAPVAAYFPRVEELLNTEIIIPHHAEVANAIGAVVGGVMQQLRVTIHPIDEPAGFRVHLFDGVHDFPTLTEAIQYAEQAVPPHLRALAREAGATQVEVKMVRRDLSAPVRGGWAEEIFLESELTFTAVGRPAIARE
jgi:N-methylhydantoinase A/oxoprolinase/acetone carboxylase beta subunit